MKNFKDLRPKTNLKEDSENGYNARYRANSLGSNNAADEPDFAVFDLAKPQALHKINSYLGAAMQNPVIDPGSVIRQIYRKLMTIGLCFDVPPYGNQVRGRPTNSGFAMPGNIRAPYDNSTRKNAPEQAPQPWIETYPLSYLGGRYGVLNHVDTFDVGKDDNITHRLGYGLILRLKYSLNPFGLYVVDPKIITTMDDPNTA